MKTLKFEDEADDPEKLREIVEAVSVVVRDWNDRDSKGFSVGAQRLMDALRQLSLLPSAEEIAEAYRGAPFGMNTSWFAVGALYIGASKRAISGCRTVEEAVEAIVALEDELAGTEFGR